MDNERRVMLLVQRIQNKHHEHRVHDRGLHVHSQQHVRLWYNYLKLKEVNLTAIFVSF